MTTNTALARGGTARRRHLAVVEPTARAIAEIPTDYLQCRDFGHAWQPYTARLAGAEYLSVIRCMRCGTERTRRIGQRGQVLATDYHYADGYQIHGLGRLTGTDRDMLRLASVQRLIGGAR